MKKTLIVILSFFYLAVAAGVPLNIHYCMGDIASVDLVGIADDECGRCGMTEKEGCCETESKFVKIEDAHQQALASKPDFTPPAIELPSSFLLTLQHENVNNDWPGTALLPPFRQQSLHLLNCVFRI